VEAKGSLKSQKGMAGGKEEERQAAAEDVKPIKKPKAKRGPLGYAVVGDDVSDTPADRRARLKVAKQSGRLLSETSRAHRSNRATMLSPRFYSGFSPLVACKRNKGHLDSLMPLKLHEDPARSTASINVSVSFGKIHPLCQLYHLSSCLLRCT
jgi:hypothetical protein